MARSKREENRPMVRVRELSNATKLLIKGNGSGAAVTKLRRDIDNVLQSLEEFDAALWKVIHQNKERLYKFLDMVGERGKNKDSSASELKAAWNKLSGQAQDLGKDAQHAAKAITRKANVN
jgi:hypothetical protein